MQAAQNYIYIVLAVLYVIYSIIQAGKKMAKNKPTVSAPSDPQRKEEFKPVQPPSSAPLPQHDTAGDLKKMLEDLLGGGPQEEIPEKHSERPVIPPAKPIPQPRQERPVPAKIVTHSTAVKATPSHSSSQTKNETKSFLSGEKKTKEKVTQEIVQEEEPSIDFDVRQAIIYSEILKRPQY